MIPRSQTPFKDQRHNSTRGSIETITTSEAISTSDSEPCETLQCTSAPFQNFRSLGCTPYSSQARLNTWDSLPQNLNNSLHRSRSLVIPRRAFSQQNGSMSSPHKPLRSVRERLPSSPTSLVSVASHQDAGPFSDSWQDPECRQSLHAAHSDTRPCPGGTITDTVFPEEKAWLTLKLEWANGANHISSRFRTQATVTLDLAGSSAIVSLPRTDHDDDSSCLNLNPSARILSYRPSLIIYREIRYSHRQSSTGQRSGRWQSSKGVAHHIWHRLMRKPKKHKEAVLVTPATVASEPEYTEGDIIFQTFRTHRSPITLLDREGTLLDWTVWPERSRSSHRHDRGQSRWRIHRRRGLVRTDEGNLVRSDIRSEAYSAWMTPEDTLLSCFSVRGPLGDTYLAREGGPFWMSRQVFFTRQAASGLHQEIDLGYFAWDTFVFNLDLRRLQRTRTDVAFLICMLEAYLAIKDEQRGGFSRRDECSRLKSQSSFLQKVSSRLNSARSRDDPS